ncbi:MAG: AgmX/PglI C-terminal domain-containing protein [Candidatus Eisenbacteria bacterium]|nr:AgmX/PglI C-terminal domain-containing protein [Candidatus Eisenbacteria bacterium]
MERMTMRALTWPTARESSPQRAIPVVASPASRVRNICLTSLGLLSLSIYVLVTRPHDQADVERVIQMLTRDLRVILHNPEIPDRAAALPEVPPAVEQEWTRVAPRSVVEPALDRPEAGGRRRSEPAPDGGATGRALAEREVTKTLAATQASMNSMLSGISGSLATTQTPATPAAVRSEAPGRGRAANEVSVSRGQAGESSALSGALVSVETVIPLGAGSSREAAPITGGRRRGSAAGGEGGAVPGVLRSNASLLAVVRRNAAGIQYCYDNELKRQPSLRGKLGVAITVSASGAVSAVEVTENTLGSAALAACVTAQIRSWRFPEIPDGVTQFQVPFVFTPPK